MNAARSALYAGSVRRATSARDVVDDVAVQRLVIDELHVGERLVERRDVEVVVGIGDR